MNEISVSDLNLALLHVSDAKNNVILMMVQYKYSS